MYPGAVRLLACVTLALVGGCLSLAGLDDDYVIGAAASVGASGGATASGPATGGGVGGGATSTAGMGGIPNLGGRGGTAGAIGYCEEAGLVACYPFEGDGNDASMNGNDATTLEVDYDPGHVGQAIVLDGDSRVTVGPSQSFGIGAFTLEVWVYPSELPAQGDRFGIADWNEVFDVWIYPWGVRCHYDLGAMAGSPIPLDTWTHVACTFDGATLRTYIDGTETASEPYTDSSPLPPPVPVFIGANEPFGDDNFIGMFDEMRVFDHARTQAEICAAASPNCP
jgi:hypothetical protein